MLLEQILEVEEGPLLFDLHTTSAETIPFDHQRQFI